MRFVVSLLLFALSMTVSPRGGAALDFPNRSVRIIIPFSPGGAPDVLLRMVAQKLSEKWGQGVVVENRVGGNTLVGTVAATKSDPDGYTLSITQGAPVSLNPYFYSKLPYEPLKELAPIVRIGSLESLFMVQPNVPAKNLGELRQPGTIAAAGNGGGDETQIHQRMHIFFSFDDEHRQVTVGEELGHHASDDTYSDVAVAHYATDGYHLVSFFDTLDDARPPARRIASSACSREKRSSVPVTTSVLPTSGPASAGALPAGASSDTPTPRRSSITRRPQSSWSQPWTLSAITGPISSTAAL